MLHECLRDLSNASVRAHLLGTDFGTDMIALTIPTERIQARIFAGEVDTSRTHGFQKTGAVHQQVFLPVWRDRESHITAGVMVESNVGQGAISEIYAAPTRYARYVTNEKRSSTFIMYEGGAGAGEQVELYFAICRDGWRMYAMAWMSHELFHQALSGPTVDTCIALQALTKTVIGGVRCGPDVRGNIDEVQSQERHELVGEHLFHNVLALYAHSEPLLLIPIFVNASYGLTVSRNVVAELRKRGLRHRVYDFVPTPSATPIVPTVENTKALRPKAMPTTLKAPNAPKASDNFVSIAPSPMTHAQDSSSPTKIPDDDDTDPDVILLRRAERRRIQNRITAARSNEKRRRARRAAVLKAG